jgi:hypothetical protein
MKKAKYVALGAALFFVIGLGGTAYSQSPSAAVAAFYKYDGSHSQTFNRRNIDARRRWLADPLYKLLLNELRREREYLKQNPTDKPHFGDGLPFRPLDEACELNGKAYHRRIRVGKVSVKGDIGNVDVYFEYSKACKLDPILYAVHVGKVKGRWLIEDILYAAEGRTLTEDLNRMEY